MESTCSAMLAHGNVMSICKGADLVMAYVDDGLATMYNLNTNKFAKVFSYSNMLFSRISDKWFYYQFDADSSTLKLKDISFDLESLLEWEEILFPGIDDEVMAEKVRRILSTEAFDTTAENPEDEGFRQFRASGP